MDFELIIESFPKLLKATELTLVLVGMTGLLGLILAFGVAMLRVSKKKCLRWPAYGYIFFFRGSPLLVQLFLIYYGLAQFEWVRASFLWPVLRQPMWCALLAFCLNTAAYTGEVLRGPSKRFRQARWRPEGQWACPGGSFTGGSYCPGR